MGFGWDSASTVKTRENTKNKREIRNEMGLGFTWYN